ncbi:hypothetical protein J2W28_001060 [Variovorax boronicumulans]|uniref:hypothetical protein n=1 Tax=Variovorax boronicumulans TaxID=436515 RepID=UPI0027848878|nr:hypothetical protein [Variovorax boronicumulans]MDP9992032.1 hypothetical protein [Variovorax boronicumulans]MDQ0001927.1 hypothetical protein [Variovorax boronicumulans]
MKLWAIRWGPFPTNPRSHGWVDWTTIGRTRREAWEKHAGNESPNATPHWRAKLKRMRRTGVIRAVRIEVTEVP